MKSNTILVFFIAFNFSFAQNPLIHSFFHEDYYDIEIVKYAENTGKLDNRICQYLVSSSKLENRLAVIDALLVKGEKINNGDLFAAFLESSYARGSLPTNEHKFLMAYLYSTTNYDKSKNLLAEVQSSYLNSLAFNIISLMIDVYYDNELNNAELNCQNWVRFQKIDLNKTFLADLKKNSIDRIAEEIDELKKYCDDQTLVITETKRDFNKIQQKSIQKINLTEVGGVYSVPIKINGVLTLDFVYDSGASYVLLSEDVFRVLLRTKTVKIEDIVGFEKFSIADGSVIEAPVFVLKELQIGDIKVFDVKTSVGNLNSDLLLGQSFQKKFKKVYVDNLTKTLNIEQY